jgi:hypothetical protein
MFAQQDFEAGRMFHKSFAVMLMLMLMLMVILSSVVEQSVLLNIPTRRARFGLISVTN